MNVSVIVTGAVEEEEEEENSQLWRCEVMLPKLWVGGVKHIHTSPFT